MIRKSSPVRSKKLRESARGCDCTLRIPGHCNGDPQTSVLCHLPHGSRGTGTKVSDSHAVIACSGCHDAIDKRALPKVSQTELYECMVRAMAETNEIWREMELVNYG